MYEKNIKYIARMANKTDFKHTLLCLIIKIILNFIILNFKIFFKVSTF